MRGRRFGYGLGVNLLRQLHELLMALVAYGIVELGKLVAKHVPSFIAARPRRVAVPTMAGGLTEAFAEPEYLPIEASIAGMSSLSSHVPARLRAGIRGTSSLSGTMRPPLRAGIAGTSSLSGTL